MKKNNVVVLEPAEFWTAVNVYKFTEKALRRIDSAKERDIPLCGGITWDDIERHLLEVQNSLNIDSVKVRAIEEVKKDREAYLESQEIDKAVEERKRRFLAKKAKERRGIEE